MPELTVTNLKGVSKTVTSRVGESLMEAIRDNGFDELMAICGGALSCATCHVYIDDPARLAALPPLSEDEDALLDSASDRRPSSRLSCQIRITDALDGLGVTIAPE